MGTVSAQEVEAELQSRLAPQKRRTALGGGEYLNHVPPLECASGLKMSVQASAFHYCSPRDSEGPWSAVEIGFPTKRVAALLPFAEEKNKPTKTVYGYVPIKILAEVIAEHGGFAREKVSA